MGERTTPAMNAKAVVEELHNYCDTVGQNAFWIAEAQNAKNPSHHFCDIHDLDHEEIYAAVACMARAAALIAQQADEIERLRGDGWQNISTAPEDGESYLFHDPVLGTIYGHWYDGDDEDEPCWFFFDWCGDELLGCAPTHWRPLPRLPRADLSTVEKEKG